MATGSPALELGAELRKVQHKNKAQEAQVKQLHERLKLREEQPPARPPTPPLRSHGPSWTSPATGDPGPPPPGSVASCGGSL